MKRALSIAGSDCSGGAGIQADLKTFSAHGVFGMSVIVSVVAENTEKVIDVQDISEDMIKKQIEAVFEDIGVDAVKIGMLSNPQCMKTVAEQMKHYKPLHIVVDPVMYAKNGCPLMDPSSIDTLVNTIIPIADIITPNIPEAEKIINSNIQSIKEMEDAAKRIYDMGCKAVIWIGLKMQTYRFRLHMSILSKIFHLLSLKNVSPNIRITIGEKNGIKPHS